MNRLIVLLLLLSLCFSDVWAQGMDTTTPSPTSDQNQETTPSPSGSEETTPSPSGSEETTPSPSGSEETTPSPSGSEETTPSPSGSEETTPSPSGLEDTTPSPSGSEETTPSPSGSEETTPSPSGSEGTTPSPSGLEDTTPSPSGSEETTPSPSESEETTPSPSESEETTAPTAEPTSIATTITDEPTSFPTAGPTMTSAPTVTPTGWKGCRDPNDSDAEIALVSSGDPMTICISLGPGGDWASEGGIDYIRYTFQPEVDEFSRFSIPDSYSYVVSNFATPNSTFGENTTIHVAAQESISFLKMYYNGVDKVYPYLTAILDVEDGEVVGIAWDDACIYCGSDRCDDILYDFSGDEATDATNPKGCFKTTDECDEATDECDITIYVVWSGTDSGGSALLSSGNRFSSFLTSSVQDAVEDIL